MKIQHCITYSEARAVIDAIVARCLETNRAAVAVVADPHGEMIAFARMDGAPLTSIRIAENKAWSAARERKPTKEIGEKALAKAESFDIAYFGDPKFLGWPGGIPVWRHGQVVGSVAVSGLTGAEDVELAELGATFVAAE